MQFNKKILKFLPALIYFIFIWLLSCNQLPFEIGKVDKYFHVMEYAVMGFLLSFGFELNNRNFIRLGKYCFLLAILSGATDEIHQCFVPWRSGSWGDLVADAIGCIIGMVVWLGLVNIISRSKFRGNIHKNIPD